MDEFTDPRAGLEQGLDHEPVFAVVAIGGLDQAFDFTLVQSGHGSFPGVRRLELQSAPHALHHVLGLIIAKVMLAPQAESLLNHSPQVSTRMRDCFLTTQFGPQRAFQAWDQNLITEWHVRYGGPGIMIYWHVEKNSVCIYSQLKCPSSSEVASMIEGLLRHDTQMNVEKQNVDTHGQSEVGFAFGYPL